LLDLETDPVWTVKALWQDDEKAFQVLRPEAGEQLLAFDADTNEPLGAVADGAYQSLDPSGYIFVASGRVTLVNDYQILTRKMLIVAALLTNLTLQQLREIPLHIVEGHIMPHLRWFDDVEEATPVAKFKHKGITWKTAKDFNDLPMLAWILLEANLGQVPDDDALAYQLMLVAIAFTQDGAEHDDEGVAERMQELLAVPYRTIQGAALHIQQEVTKIRNQYANLFARKEDEHLERTQKAWKDYYEKGGWLAVMADLGYNVSKEAEVQGFYSSKVSTVFKAISLQMQRSKIEQEEQKEQAKKAKQSRER